MIWLIFILLEIARNYYLIEVRKTKPYYLQSSLLRGAAGILYGIIIGVSPQEYLPVFIFQITSFWILFDIGLNLARKESIFYTGDPKKGSSGWIDYLPVTLYWILKAVALIGMIFGIIKSNLI